MNEVAKEFIERMGLLAERDGAFPRIAGRLLAYLMLDGTPKTLDDIANDLRISKASASTNARLLEQMGLLERVSLFGDRRDFYRIGESPWENMFAVARQRIEEVTSIIDQTTPQMPDDMEAARTRLEKWGQFYHFMLEDIDQRAADWRERLQEKDSSVDAK